MDPLQNSGFTGCLSKAGLAEGTNTITIKIAAPNGAGVDFGVAGLAYHKADTDNIAMNALAVQAVSSSCLYLVQITGANAVSLKKGNEVLTADLTAGKNNLQWPFPDADNVALGGIKVVTDATATFTCGVTDLGAGNVTDTYYDFVGGLPELPIVS